MSNNKKQRRMSQIPRDITLNQTVQIPAAAVANSPDVECLDCGGIVFIPGQRMKKVSAIISPDGIAKYVQFPVMVCLKCQAVLPEKP